MQRHLPASTSYDPAAELVSDVDRGATDDEYVPVFRRLQYAQRTVDELHLLCHFGRHACTLAAPDVQQQHKGDREER